MEMPIQFDTLDYAKKLENAGVPVAQAEAHASALGDVLGKTIVVHGELAAVEDRLCAKIDVVEGRLNAKIDGVDDRLNARIDLVEDHLNVKIDTVNIKIDAFEEKMNGKFEVLEQKFDARIDKLELKFTSEMNTMRWMMGTLIFLVSGLLIRQLQV